MRALIICGLAIVFAVIETRFFGWNFAPASDAEVLADGMAVILLAMSVLAAKGGGA